MAINLKTTVLVSQAAIPALADTQGCIVNFASIAYFEPQSPMAVYSAAKAAVAGFTRSLALELADRHDPGERGGARDGAHRRQRRRRGRRRAAYVEMEDITDGVMALAVSGPDAPTGEIRPIAPRGARLMELGGRVALVTGAGRRLGQAMARALAGRGHDRSPSTTTPPATGAARAAGRDRRRGRPRRLLRRRPDRRRRAAAELPAPRRRASWAGSTCWSTPRPSCTGSPSRRPRPPQYDAVLDLNLRSVFFVHPGRRPALRAARGKVVNMADLGGLEPWPGFAAHSVSKAGVVMLTKVLARALAPDVTVNAIAPGTVLVPEEYDAEERDRLARTTPLRRLGTPEDAIAALLYLLEGGDFVTGEVLVVDGGRLLR